MNKKYDLILLDHMMPEMDGIHTLYNLKKRAHGFETPVVVLTANAIEGSRDMYLREGFSDYLSKPIDVQELNSILKKFLITINLAFSGVNLPHVAIKRKKASVYSPEQTPALNRLILFLSAVIFFAHTDANIPFSVCFGYAYGDVGILGAAYI